MQRITAHPSRRSARRARVLAPVAVALGFVAFAAPASAVVVAPGAAPFTDATITVFPDNDTLIAEGLPAGTVDVRVLRGATVIGQSTGAPVVGGAVEVNHLGGTDCFDGPTPDVLPGDVVQFLTAPDTGIQMTVRDATINDAIDNGGGNVTVTGTAIVPAGATFLVRLVKGRGGAHLEASGDPGDPGTTLVGPDPEWTAEFTAVDALGEAEARIIEGGAVTTAVPTPEFACGPPARSALASLSRTVVNIANAAQPVTASGPLAGGVSVADVKVNGTSITPANIDQADGSWTAQIAPGELREGLNTVVASFSGPGAPGAGAPGTTLTLVRDTVAPQTPTATPGPGTYSFAQEVTLSSPDSTIRWTNAATGEPNFLASGSISVTASQTIRARATDAAGNPSAVASFAYVIQPPVAAGGTAGGTVVGGVVGVQGSASDPSSQATVPLALQSLGMSAKIRRATLRKRGVRLTMRLREGTRVLRIRVYRKLRNGARLLMATGYRAPAAAGLYRTRITDRKLLRRLKVGSYEVEVTPGRGRTDLGTPARYAFKVIPR